MERGVEWRDASDAGLQVVEVRRRTILVREIGWRDVSDAGPEVVEHDAPRLVVDARVVPMRRQALDESTRWAAVAVETWHEQGPEALRRHHHRRLEELFIRWCQALEPLGHGALVADALATLRETHRLEAALAQLDAHHDAALWQRLARRQRTAPDRIRHELEHRWRLHAVFVRRGPCDESALRRAL